MADKKAATTGSSVSYTASLRTLAQAPENSNRSMSIDGGIRAAADYIRLPQKPNVIFCDSDSIALGVLYELNRSGIRIPADVSIISIGLYHSSVTRCSIPPLTVSEVPLRKMAETCMDRLTEIIREGTSEPVHSLLETSITIRESFL